MYLFFSFPLLPLFRSVPVLTSIAADRLNPMAALPDFPLDQVTLALATLHHHMRDMGEGEGGEDSEDNQEVASSQYLDLLEIFPKLYE